MKKQFFIVAIAALGMLGACSQDGHQQSSSPTLTGETAEDSSSTEGEASSATRDTGSVVGDTSAVNTRQ